MAAKLGKNIVVLHDQYNLTASLDSGDVAVSADSLETTVFSNNSKTYIPGTKDGTISVEGFSDSVDATAGIDAVQFADLGNTSTLLTLSTNTSAGSKAYLADTTQNEWGVATEISGLNRITGAYQTAQDGVDYGVLLLPVTTATSTADGASFDRGATAAAGSVGILHVTAASGTSETLDVDIEIDDNSGFTSPVVLFSFSQKTAISAQRVESTTAILAADRYVRAAYTVGGSTPSFTFAVSWAAR